MLEFLEGVGAQKLNHPSTVLAIARRLEEFQAQIERGRSGIGRLP